MWDEMLDKRGVKFTSGSRLCAVLGVDAVVRALNKEAMQLYDRMSRCHPARAVDCKRVVDRILAPGWRERLRLHRELEKLYGL